MNYPGINMVQDMANYIKKLTEENEKLKAENKKLKEDNEQLKDENGKWSAECLSTLMEKGKWELEARYWKEKYYKLSRGESTRITCIFKEEE